MNCPRRHTCWQSKRLYWEGVPGWRAGGWGNPGRPLCPMAGSLRVYGDGISFRVVTDQSFWLRVLPGGACIAQPRCMPARRILGGGRTCGVSFWSFLNSSGWRWRISSMFLTRTSYHKTAHANGYSGAWPGWLVWVSVLPLTWGSASQVLVHLQLLHAGQLLLCYWTQVHVPDAQRCYRIQACSAHCTTGQ